MQKTIPFLLVCIFVKPGLLQYDDEYLQSADPLLRKFWGIQDVTTSVGKLFHYKIPDDAFKGKIVYYDVVGEENTTLPKWMVFDKKNAVLEGVPSINDVGDIRINVKAYDSIGQSVSDMFVVEVDPILEKNTNQKRRCKKGEGVTMISIAVNKDLNDFTPVEKIFTLKQLAQHLYVPVDTLLLLPSKWSAEIVSKSRSLHNDDASQNMNASVVTWQIGCNERIWAEKIQIVESVDKLIKDGKLSEILQLPIVRWDIGANFNPFRKRRHTPPENDSSQTQNEELDENADQDGADDDDDEEEDDGEEDGSLVPVNPSPVLKEMSSKQFSEYANRNANKGPIINSITNTTKLSKLSSSTNSSNLLPSPLEEDTTEMIEEEENDDFATPVLSSVSPNITSDIDKPSTTDKPTTVEPKRYPPRVAKNLDQIRVEAGKPYKAKIPEDIFLDEEDGNTRNLTLKLIKTDNCSLFTPWIEFNSETQELYILANLDTISKHNFSIEASDSDGMSISNSLLVDVQYPQNARTINFEISLHMKLRENQKLTAALQFDLLDSLANLYGDTDSTKIAVRNVTCDPFVFTWANVTLSSQVCDNKTIAELLNVLTETEWGMNVNTRVKQALGSLVIVEKVTWHGIGLCSEIPPAQLPRVEKQNFKPVVRNAIDNITAVVGELKIFEVPKDTFYDADEPNGRNLKLTLLNSDHSPVPSDNWLQFDSTNQEFYGLPMANDVGAVKYQLVCFDDRDSNDSMKAIHGLEVIVESATKAYYNVEFRMKLSVSYTDYIKSPLMRRTFVEKLAKLFGDLDTSSIVVSGFSPGSLIVTWHNKSLPMKECKESEILQLRKVLLTDDGKLDDNVNKLLKPEFEAISADITPIGICEGGLTEFHPLPEINTGSQEIQAIIFNNLYFTNTILPIIIIIIMIFVAGLIACILYRRQRRAKWTLGDGDERKSFRNKGIPVIFQDELEERLEPTNKSPIIMKEEKPPLPPPEYQKVAPVATTALLSDFDDPSYQQGSGTFNSRSNERNGRSKTPTYRKPPPYISQ